MSTVQTWQMESTSLEQTLEIASRIGAKLKGGEVIELVSDLGGGKTAFVRGLAKGSGSEDRVSSPSFTLTNQYEAGAITIHHFDFYRLSDPGILREELAEILSDRSNVVVIEWADVISDILPDERLQTTIQPTGENSRHFTFTAPPSLTYLLSGDVH